MFPLSHCHTCHAVLLWTSTLRPRPQPNDTDVSRHKLGQGHRFVVVGLCASRVQALSLDYIHWRQPKPVAGCTCEPPGSECCLIVAVFARRRKDPTGDEVQSHCCARLCLHLWAEGCVLTSSLEPQRVSWSASSTADRLDHH